MMLLDLVLLFGVLVGAQADDADMASNLPKCRSIDDDFTKFLPKYHSNSVCDRSSPNTFRHRLSRGYTYRNLLPLGASQVATTKTVVCPDTATPSTPLADLTTSVNDDNDEGPPPMLGFSTAWLVENTASTPIVVAWVNPHNGREYSANNGKTSPPHYDPQTIVQPGHYKFFNTYESHVFHIRALLEDGTLGEVLLQHRQGLIPIRNQYGPPDLYCDPLSELDPEPLVEPPPEIEDVEAIRDPEYARTDPNPTPLCNVMDIGFRNEVGCPLNAYFTGMESSVGNQGEPTCDEKFQFHLGIQSKPNDFVWDWTSQTKWESSYVGHNFKFRLAKDPSVLIDKITIEPTYVTDCPNQKRQARISAEMLINPIGILRQVPSHLANNETSSFSNTTTTRRQRFNTTSTTTTASNYHHSLVSPMLVTH